ncbi:MAG: zinc-ribbon domain-containing protein [Deltaproteobacteria bacterium]|nr:zinc-ribbon domain-containing protein [Deltaproteobacteria bacterium]
MKIVCDSCGAKYSIADEKVAGKIFKIRCKKCSSVLEVRGDQTGAHPFGGVTSPQGPGGEPTWYIVVDGEQQGPLRPIELSQLFAKGSVGLDSYVWKEGFDDWKVAGDVADLATVFGGAAAQAKSAAADDTSSFGTGGDLFSDGNGREPTSEIDTSGNMFAGFDENPTPTGSQDSPLGATADGSGAAAGIAGFGGGAVGASTPQRMTGQRNENSVLFSLTNLQQLASRGGTPAEAAPAAASQVSASTGAPAALEGSGLIDIRALAKSTTPGTKTAPSQAVEDLLAIGTGGGASLGTPLLGPAPLDTSDSNRWLWIGGAAIAVLAIVGAGVGVGMVLGGSGDDALEITAATGQEPSEPMPGSNEVATAAQVPAEPPEDALAVAEPIEAATIEEPTEAEIQAPAPKKRTSASSQRRQRTSRSSSKSTASAKPAPKKRSSNNLDALMDEVVGGSSPSKSKQTTRSSSSSSSSLPGTPTRNDVKTALQGVSGAVKSCKKDSGGTAAVSVVFSGKTGRVSSAKVTSGPFKGTAVGSCIASAAKRARVPRFKQGSFKVTFPYRL